MLEALTVTEISRRDLRADTSLVPAFQGLLSEASDRPERLQQQRFYLPLGAVLVAAFHNLPDPNKITSEALVGAALLNFDFDPHRYPQVCLLNGLAVRPDLQRQKTGKPKAFWTHHLSLPPKRANPPSGPQLRSANRGFRNTTSSSTGFDVHAF